MIKFNEEDRKRISEAVKEAELRTSGEIATAIIPQSNDYAVQELTFAVIISLIYGTLLVVFTQQIETWLSGMFWHYRSWYLSAFYIFSSFLVILIFYFLANLPFLDRLIVSKETMADWVKKRALQHFSESGVGHTKDGTGILIFISLLERRVELLADTGIAAKVDQSRWQNIVNNIISGIHNDHLVSSLCESIQECGKLLEADFPHQRDDVNELADGIVELKQ